MDALKQIKEKLNKFIKLHYLHKLVKGVFLFISISSSYAIVIATIERNLWLSERGRVILFYSLLLVSALCFVRYILLHLLSLFRIVKGLSLEEASKIIGLKIPLIDDKLLNLIQLSKISNKNELLLASIDQKCFNLSSFTFAKAVSFKDSLSFFKYLLIPFVIIMVLVLSKEASNYSASLERITNYQKEYIEPAPFSFSILNNTLEVTEYSPYTLRVKLNGDNIPKTLSIAYHKEMFLSSSSSREKGLFEYTFVDIKKDLSFRLKAGKFFSETYTIHVNKVPVIDNIVLTAIYPKYIQKKKAVLSSVSEINVPRGTFLEWVVKTRETTKAEIKTPDKLILLSSNNNVFKTSYQILKDTEINLTVSNNIFDKYESLYYSINALPDYPPRIRVELRTDSIFVNQKHHYGLISDDYGIRKLQLVYYKVSSPSKYYRLRLKTSKHLTQEFYYTFPIGLSLEESTKYAYFFQVYDNDQLPRSKSSRSKLFLYNALSKENIKKESLSTEKKSLGSLENLLDNYNHEKNKAFFINNKVDYKSTKFIDFLKKELQQQKMMEKFTKDLTRQQQQLLNHENKNLKERLEREVNRIKTRKELIKKIKNLAKQNNPNLKDKLSKLKKQNKIARRNLNQILELTKQNYLQKKLELIMERALKLAEKIISSKEQDLSKQKNYQKIFQEIKKALQEAEAFNQTLIKEKNIRRDYALENDISKDLKDALGYIEKNKKNIAEGVNKQAANKLKKLAENLKEENKKGMEMQLKMDITTMRQIMDNLLALSFREEDLIQKTKDLKQEEDYSLVLKKQHELKQIFQHVDDSIYALSLSQPKIAEKINKQVEEVHYYTKKTLENLLEKRNNNAASDQRFLLSNLNLLGSFLSDILENIKLSMDGSKKEKNAFQLPDIIKKQKKLMDQLEKQQQQQESLKEEILSKAQVNAYKKLQEINQMMKKLINKKQEKSGKQISKEMKKTEEELLKNGFTKSLRKQVRLVYQKLLEYEEAHYTKGENSSRESKTNQKTYKNNNPALEYFKDFRESQEILWRESLPIKKKYEPVINNYFNESIEF